MEVRAGQPPQSRPSQVLDQDHLEPKNQNEAEVVEPEQFNQPPPSCQEPDAVDEPEREQFNLLPPPVQV